MTAPPGGLSARLPRVPLATLTVLHQRGRTLVAMAGIAFAVLFMFVQLGFLGAVERTAVALSEQVDADLVLVSPRHLFMGSPGTLPRGRLSQARADPGIASAQPLYVAFADLRNLETGNRAKMLAVGIPPGEPVLRVPEVLRDAGALARGMCALVDTEVREVYEPLTPGSAVEIRGRRTEVLDRFRLGIGFLGDGALVVGDQTFSILFHGFSLDTMHLGLLKLAPGAQREEVLQRLREELPTDARVITYEELQEIQVRRWLRDTSLGNVFILGTALGFVVGFVVLYQILATGITQQLPEYATLKAMGYPGPELSEVVLRQSLLFACLGFLPGYLLAEQVYDLAYAATKLPIAMTAARIGGVLVLTVTMCAGSGLLALGRLARADPADLFS